MSYPETFTIALDGGQQVTGLEYLAEGNRLGARLILAHGAGAPQTSAFMVAFATGLARRGVDVGTFNFQYTEKRRRVPDSSSELERCYIAAIEAFTRRTPDRLLFIGGKSMGGRIATQVAASDAAIRRVVDGLVLLGYPLHPPGRPGQLRAAHLSKVGRPMLFVQGSRDSLGTPDQLARALDAIEPRATIHVVDGGDHSFKVRASSPVPQEDVYREIEERIVAWVKATRTDSG